MEGRYRFGNGVEKNVTVNDLSIHGCCLIDRFSDLEPGGFISIEIGSIGPVQALVRWRRKDDIGIEFSRPLDAAALHHIWVAMDG